MWLRWRTGRDTAEYSAARSHSDARPLDAAAPASTDKTSLTAESWQQEWWFHYGWNRPGDVPAPLPATDTTIRKVQINDAYDIGRWWWRATDGIRETTWPGVYNRSRHRWPLRLLPACRTGTATRSPARPSPSSCRRSRGTIWSSAAARSARWTLLTPDVSEDDVRRAGLDGKVLPAKTLFERPSGQETTFHDFATPVTGGKLRFVNVEQETPIGEFSAYYVHPGAPPAGIVQLKYRLSPYHRRTTILASTPWSALFTTVIRRTSAPWSSANAGGCAGRNSSVVRRRTEPLPGKDDPPQSCRSCTS